MNKTLNQRIYETPADVKKALYDSGYEAGKKYATALIFAEIDRLYLHVANEYEARAYEELKKQYGVQ